MMNALPEHRQGNAVYLSNGAEIPLLFLSIQKCIHALRVRLFCWACLWQQATGKIKSNGCSLKTAKYCSKRRKMYILRYVNIRYNHMEKDYPGKTAGNRQVPSCGYSGKVK